MKYTAGLISFAVIRTKINTSGVIMTQKRKVEDTLSSNMPIRQQDDTIRKCSTNLCMTDNPFWGSSLSKEHDLAFLLKEMKDGCLKSEPDNNNENHNGKARSNNNIIRPPGIIYEDENYLVLNKPADLRMDGPYLASVHKLLTYWYPSPSLLARVQVNASGGKEQEEEDRLMEEVLNLNTFNDLKDNELRPAHQLDYATSGVLLVCRSKKTAAAANAAFEKRQTDKEYIALVHGHLSCDDNIPILDEIHLSQWVDGSKEKSYRKTKERKHKTTFSGFMPTHTIFQKWKQYYQKQTQQKKQQKQNSRQYDELHQQIFQIATDSLSIEEQQQLVNSKWNHVKSNVHWVQTFQKMANHYNSNVHPSFQTNKTISTTNDNDVKTLKQQTPLPHIFRIQGEDSNSFYVHASLSQIKDDFRMQVDPSALNSKQLSSEYKKHYSNFHQTKNYNANGSSRRRNYSLDFKPSLTRVTILSQGSINISNDDKSEDQRIKSTRVKLQPRTGRRHQLRLHMVVCGHPIIGDVTYQPPISDDCKNEVITRGNQERMCLHAHRLTIPLLCNQLVTFEAPDPFHQNLSYST